MSASHGTPSDEQALVKGPGGDVVQRPPAGAVAAHYSTTTGSAVVPALDTDESAGEGEAFLGQRRDANAVDDEDLSLISDDAILPYPVGGAAMLATSSGVPICVSGKEYKEIRQRQMEEERLKKVAFP
ncbi:hypothetical protein JCM10213_007631 [Rhodosporidiobolus nylandii]